MTNTPPPVDARDLRTRFYDWFFGLDLATKLLIAICVGVYFAITVGIPTGRKWMNEDMDKMTTANRETMDKVIESWNTQINKTIESYREDQERDQKLIERLLGDKHVANGDDAIAIP